MAVFRSTCSSKPARHTALPSLFMAAAVMVVALLPVAMTVPECEWQDEVTRCSVRKQSDFAALPTNVTRLTVYFPEGHQAALQAAAFPVRPNLVELTLDLTNMESSLEPGVFILLEPLTKLSMVYNHAIYAPAPMVLAAGVFNGLPFLRELSMQGVGLVQVEQGAFHNLPSLMTLDLGVNELTTFPSSAFTDTTELVTLVFSHNKLSALVDGTFNGLSKLQTLNLDNNKLRVLGGSTFGNLPALQTLSLDGNTLRSIGLGTFQGLPQLTNLQLKNNELVRIDAHILKGLGSLENLDMSHNNIIEIADLAFSELSELKFLEIYQNAVRRLTPMTFLGLRKLVFLDMYINSISELQDDVFRDLQDLGTLHLHQANIEKISAGAFNGLTSLNILTLQQNNLTTLPEGVFASLEQIAFLDIAQNPWNCTCDVTWLHPWSDGRNFGSETSTRCANNGESLLQYARDNYYICRRTTTTTTTTVAPTTATTTLPIITTQVVDEITSPPLIKLTSSMDPGYMTTNDSALDGPSVKQGGFSANHLIIICVAVSAVFILAVIIAVLIIYCRQKKCAFWTPEHVSTIPATTTIGGSEKDHSHFAYSPTKEQSFFGDQPIGSLERRRGKSSNGSAPTESAYDNPGLYIEDGMPHHDQPADAAVVAYISENGVQHRNGHLPHYEHRVSDSGTHYVDRVPHTTDDLPMNDLNHPVSSSDVQKPVKKERKRKQSKKPKKSSVSSSDNGDDPYGEVYAPASIPLSDMIPTPPASLDNSMQDTSMDSPDHLPPGYPQEHSYPQEHNCPQEHSYPHEHNLSHRHGDPEHDSALGASTEERFEDPPTPKPRTTRCIPRHQDHYSDQNLGEDAANEEDQMKRHSDSIGGNSDYVDYRHSYNEDKPLY